MSRFDLHSSDFIEKKFVLDMYNQIADHFSDTRYCIWNMVKNFLIDKSENEYGLEIGCGNGKNLLINPKLNIIGLDNSIELLTICKKKKLNVVEGNCCNLPFNNNQFNYIMSIAVFHHLYTEKRRIIAINEMIRVLKQFGKGIISMWSFENQEKRKFSLGNNIVTWIRKSDNKTFNRYYYIYNYDDIIQLFNQIENIKIDQIYNEYGNWVIEFTKL
tara:strand:- start:841 stop:1488 length:648 start_codon:yes stop_codon:yes gene_type:complete